MATYVVGDVQGCFLTFQKLLLEINFNENTDRMILLGDVVNRGPNSLEMVRYLKSHQESMEMLLGNHDIFAIALDLGAYESSRAHTLNALLKAPDREELFTFLRRQPLIKKLNEFIFVHAGILPAVSIEEAIESADKISALLQTNDAKKFLKKYFEKIPHEYKPDMRPKKALRFALSYLTLLRMCESKTVMDLTYTGVIDKAPKRLKPWFSLRNDEDHKIYFGHWAALGVYQQDGYYCLDSGCGWGNKLTALRLKDQKIFQVENCESEKP